MEILIKVLRNSSLHIIFKMKDASYMGLNIPGAFLSCGLVRKIGDDSPFYK